MHSPNQRRLKKRLVKVIDDLCAIAGLAGYLNIGNPFTGHKQGLLSPPSNKNTILFTAEFLNQVNTLN